MGCLGSIYLMSDFCSGQSVDIDFFNRLHLDIIDCGGGNGMKHHGPDACSLGKIKIGMEGFPCGY